MALKSTRNAGRALASTARCCQQAPTGWQIIPRRLNPHDHSGSGAEQLRLFTAVLAEACCARYRAIASTERKDFAMFRNSLRHAFSAGMRAMHRKQVEFHRASLFCDCFYNGPGGAVASSSPAAWLKLRLGMLQPVNRRAADASFAAARRTCERLRKLASSMGLSVRSWRNAIARTTGPGFLLLRRYGRTAQQPATGSGRAPASPCVAAKNLASSLRTALLSQLAVCPAPEDGVESGAWSGGRRCLAPGRRPHEQLREMPQWRSQGCPSREWFASARRDGSAADEESASAGGAGEDAKRWARN